MELISGGAIEEGQRLYLQGGRMIEGAANLANTIANVIDYVDIAIGAVQIIRGIASAPRVLSSARITTITRLELQRLVILTDDFLLEAQRYRKVNVTTIELRYVRQLGEVLYDIVDTGSDVFQQIVQLLSG
jgi:hypothetical protein